MLDIPIKDHFRETRIFTTRLTVSAVVVGLLCLLLLGRLIYLQVIHHSHFKTLSQENRINPLPIPPVRGLILDRNGVVLAQNYPAFTLELIPDQIDDIHAMLAELGQLVELKPSDLARFDKLLATRPHFESLPLRTNLTDEEAARVAVQRPHLNGVELHARLLRHYPLRGLGIHFIGYVGRINEEEMKVIDKSAYRGTQHIGKLGVELSYESVLHGQPGIEKKEVNAHGRAIRTIERISPRAGMNLYLNIDIRMQALAEKALAGQRGAVVAIEPSTGAVMTFASMPTYDPNPFVNGIDTESYNRLLTDPDKPLINRALRGQYAPGSTIKPFMALAGLESGTISPSDKVRCPGWFSLPTDSHRFRDWKKNGHGIVNMHDAIVQSCDVYFYTLAVELGIDTIKSFLNRVGFGEKTGIDMKLESTGLVPSPEWKQARGEVWYPGETVVTGIGQGPLLVTPLQLAVATAALGNDGIRPVPRLTRALEDPVTHKYLGLKPKFMPSGIVSMQQHLREIIADMTDVVHGEGGTARRIGWDAPYKIAGKTGTAQVKSIGQTETYDAESTPERLRDHALFISFAPADNPKIAVVVVVENGGHGSSAAAPIARKIMDYYLLKNKREMLTAS